MRWLCVVLLLVSCAHTEKLEEKVLAASPAEDSGFLENSDKMAPHPERAPFDRVWWAQDFSWGHYTKMYVTAVDTHHLLSMSIWEQINIRSIDVKQDIADIALEFHQDVEKAFQDDPAHHFEILQDPKLVDDKTIVIQLALVELVPNKAALGVLGTAAWAAPLAIGIPLGTIAAFTDQGSISFEGRARDGGTGRGGRDVRGPRDRPDARRRFPCDDLVRERARDRRPVGEPARRAREHAERRAGEAHGLLHASALVRVVGYFRHQMWYSPSRICEPSSSFSKPGNASAHSCSVRR